MASCTRYNFVKLSLSVTLSAAGQWIIPGTPVFSIKKIKMKYLKYCEKGRLTPITLILGPVFLFILDRNKLTYFSFEIQQATICFCIMERFSKVFFVWLNTGMQIILPYQILILHV